MANFDLDKISEEKLNKHIKTADAFLSNIH